MARGGRRFVLKLRVVNGDCSVDMKVELVGTGRISARSGENIELTSCEDNGGSSGEANILAES